jgi:acyl-CoA synthetase
MTGDLGWLDQAGYLRITGRKKELIIRGGRNIYPARIEAAALRLDGVERAAAFGVADARLGERVCLAVVARAGRPFDPRALVQDLDRLGLARHELPEFVLSLPEMPLTASGKILKRDLARSVAEGHAQPIAVRD